MKGLDVIFDECKNTIPRPMPFIFVATKCKPKVFIKHTSESTRPFVLAAKIAVDGLKKAKEAEREREKTANMSLGSYDDRYNDIVEKGMLVCQEHCEHCAETWKNISKKVWDIDKRSDYIEQLQHLTESAKQAGLHCFQIIAERHYPKRYQLFNYSEDGYEESLESIKEKIQEVYDEEEIGNFFFAIEYWDTENETLQYFTHMVTDLEDEENQEDVLKLIAWLDQFLQESSNDLY